jgi:hypothetical protein
MPFGATEKKELALLEQNVIMMPFEETEKKELALLEQYVVMMPFEKNLVAKMHHTIHAND